MIREIVMDYTAFCEFRYQLTNAHYLSDLKNICQDFSSHVGLEYFFWGFAKQYLYPCQKS